MIFNIEVDSDELIESIVNRIDYDDISEQLDYSELADRVDLSEVAGHIDIDDLVLSVARNIDYEDIAETIDSEKIFANVSINYVTLAECIVDESNFRNEIADILWLKFADEFSPALRDLREEMQVIYHEVDKLNRPFWKRWF